MTLEVLTIIQLISADIDGVKGDSKSKGQLVDIDARAFPPKPKAKPTGAEQPKEIPKEQPKPVDKTPKPPVDGSDEKHAEKKEQDVSRSPCSGFPFAYMNQLVNADLDRVKGNSKAHGQLIDLDARGNPPAQPKKQNNVSTRSV